MPKVFFRAKTRTRELLAARRRTGGSGKADAERLRIRWLRACLKEEIRRDPANETRLRVCYAVFEQLDDVNRVLANR